MEEQESATAGLAASTERMANIAEQLGALLAKMEQQFETLNAKVDRIVAAIDEAVAAPAAPEQKASADEELKRRVEELEKKNAELNATAQQARRKTLSATTLVLLAKNAGEDGTAVEGAALEKALRSLSVEQRIAVKAEMARAGLL